MGRPQIVVWDKFAGGGLRELPVWDTRPMAMLRAGRVR